MLRESFAPDWTDEEDYRGANANMHAVEAFLALADGTADAVWLRRALRIAERFVHVHAARHGFRVVEHFDQSWRVLRAYNRDAPDDALRPHGVTPGHFLEWAHLLVKIEAALIARGAPAPDWLADHAGRLFAAAVACWDEARPGLPYTLDWTGRPQVGNRAHWVHAEAVIAAATLHRRTGDPAYEAWYRAFWDYVDLHLVDRARGSWHNEVDEQGAPSSRVYPGKADLYHAYQATLAPLLPPAPCYAHALAAGLTAPPPQAPRP